MKEVEVKARLRDEAQVIQKLLALDVSLSKPMTQKDIVFFPKGLAFEDRHDALALRIRDQDGRYIFTYKKPDKNNLDKIEYETDITDPAAMEKICLALDLEEIVRINKSRRKANHGGYEICLDEVEGLGSFIEVEKMTEDGDSEQIQAELFAFLKTLGVTKEDQVFEGYDVMLYKLQNK